MLSSWAAVSQSRSRQSWVSLALAGTRPGRAGGFPLLLLLLVSGRKVVILGFGKGAGIALYASLLNIFAQQARWRSLWTG